jgi:hypothetical protein
MTDVLIDTSAWIQASKQGGEQWIVKNVAQLLKNNRAVISEPIIFEILAGVKPHERKFWETRLYGVKHIGVRSSDWYTAADFACKLRRNGITVKNFDILIATIAIENNLILLHRDRDFDRISEYLPLKIFGK